MWTKLFFRELLSNRNLMKGLQNLVHWILWTKFRCRWTHFEFKWPSFFCTTNIMNLIIFSWSKFEIWWTDIDFSELKLMNSLSILWTIKWIQFHKILNPRELNFVIYVGELIMNSSELFFCDLCWWSKTFILVN